VFIVGVTFVNGYEEERDLRMAVGDSAEVGGYRFTFNGVVGGQGPNYDYQRGRIEVSKDGHPVTVLYPEKRHYWPMTEAAIDTGFFGDLYASLGEPVGGGAWSVRLYYKPFVDWIWGGCLIMAFGGLLAVSDKRYRIKVKEKGWGSTPASCLPLSSASRHRPSSGPPWPIPPAPCPPRT